MSRDNPEARRARRRRRRMALALARQQRGVADPLLAECYPLEPMPARPRVLEWEAETPEQRARRQRLRERIDHVVRFVEEHNLLAGGRALIDYPTEAALWSVYEAVRIQLRGERDVARELPVDWRQRHAGTAAHALLMDLAEIACARLPLNEANHEHDDVEATG